MSQAIRILEPLGERAAVLPLGLGGADADLALPGVEGPAVQLTASGRQWQVQPQPDAAVTLNGMPLHTSQPVAEGDVIAAGAAQVTLHPDSGVVRVVHLAGNATVAPLRQQLLPGEEVVAGVREIFAAKPAAAATSAAASGRRWRWVAGGVIAVLLLAMIGVMLALVPVPLQVQPAAAEVDASGPLRWRSGDRVFLLPGRRTLSFSHAGYRPETVTLDVSRALATAQPLQLTLEFLPGIIEVDTGGVAAEVLVDGEPAGMAPGAIEVAAGTRDVILRAPRHVDHVASLQVQGGGAHQSLKVELQPSVGVLLVDTDPSGATVRVDGKEQGRAPLRLELDAGLHQLALTGGGRRAWNSEVAIIAGRTLDLGRIDLTQSPAVAMRAAEERQTEAVAAAGGGSATPADGTPAPASAAPRPPPAPRVSSPLLGTLVLFPAGEYVQGSDRREQGRRSNEVQRMVKLTRPFYLASTEVSNAQFRAFRAAHASGIAMEKSIDLDPQAVSGVSWNDAVEFCNWLSLRESLPVAYERRDGRWQLVQPYNQGYRLPTEAEWEYAARYVDGSRWQRFMWGDVLPPPPGAANLAGEELRAAKLTGDTQPAPAVPEYRDEHAVVAPVDSYGRTPAGLHGMGGNVSEWTHDVYVSLPDAAPATDPMGATGDGPHAVRGPNWRSATIQELRAAWRERGVGPSQVVGFRVARFAEPAP